MSSTTRPTEKPAPPVNLPHLLEILIDRLYDDCWACVREYVSNSFDALHGIDDPNIEVRAVDDSVLVFSDNGRGMTRDEVINGFVTIAGHRASEAAEGKTVGMFGLGVLSAFMVADAIVVETRSEADKTGWKLTWKRKTPTEYDLETINRQKRGTEARLHLSNAPKREFRWMASEDKLRDYIERTFALLPFPVRVGKDSSPANKHQPWLANDLAADMARERDEAFRVAHQEFRLEDSTTGTAPVTATQQPNGRVVTTQQALELVRERTDPEVPVSAVFVGQTLEEARVFLGMPSDANEPLNEHNIAVFRRGVFIEKKPRKFWPEHLAFLVGLVDFPDLEIRLDRHSYLETDEAFREFQDFAADCGLRFLELLGEKADEDRDPDLIARPLRIHGKMLIPHANKEPRLLSLLRRHYRFKTTSGEDWSWEKLAATARVDPKDPTGPRVLYICYPDSPVTRDDLESALGRGIEVVLAGPGVRTLLERLGKSDRIRIAGFEEGIHQTAEVAQPFHALRARMTPYLNEKGIVRIEFFKAPDEASTPANFKIERINSRSDRKQSATPESCAGHGRGERTASQRLPSFGHMPCRACRSP